MAYWGKRKLTKNIETSNITLGGSINTYLPSSKIKRNECVSNSNVSTHKFPSLSCRRGRANFATQITTPNGAGVYLDSYLHVVDGTTWKRWDGSAWQTVASGLANAKASFTEFNTAAKRYIIMMNGTEKKAWDGTSVTNLTAATATKMYTVDDYRLYALSGNTLTNSAASVPTDWTTVLDAGSNNLVGAKGSATAVCTYNDQVISFFENSMHVLYGNDPYDFYFSDPMEYGCFGWKSLIEHEGKLYFMNSNGIYIYTGGIPIRISDKIKSYIDGIAALYKGNICMGKHGKYIYISIPYGAVTANNITIEFDTELGLWNIHNAGYDQFVNIAGSLIGIDTAGKSWTINSGTTDNGTAISWEWISGVIDYSTISKKKTLSKQFWSIDLPLGSSLDLYYSETVDNSDWALLHSFVVDGDEQIETIDIPITTLYNCDRYRLKLVGSGPCTIENIEEQLRIKPR